VAGATIEVTPSQPRGTPENPIPIARIHEWDRARGLLQRTVHTEASGVVDLRGLEPGLPWMLRVHPQGDLRGWEQDPWTPADTEVRLERGYSVRGRVQDGQGRPIASAQVQSRSDSGWGSAAQTGADGTFQIAGRPRGPVVLRAVAPGVDGHLPPGPELTVQAGTDGVVLTVDPGVSLVVRVTNPEVRGSDPGRRNLGLLVTFPADRGPGIGGWAHDFEGTGRMTVMGLRADTRYTVWLEPQGTEWYGLATDVRPGEREVSITLVRGGSISGRVRAPPSAQHVSVHAQGGASLSVTAQVDAEGRYELKGLPPGTWTVYAYGRADGKSLQAKGEAVVGGTLDLTLEERGR
jgi:hypothetical protein